jgi:hypothetical protein
MSTKEQIAHKLEWCPGLGQELQDATTILGTTNLVVLVLFPTGPAAHVASELLKGHIPAKVIHTRSEKSGFVISTDDAKTLLRTFCKAAGNYVANQLEECAEHHQFWTLKITTEIVEATGYSDDKATFLVVSDFRSQNAYAVGLQEEEEVPRDVVEILAEDD